MGHRGWVTFNMLLFRFFSSFLGRPFSLLQVKSQKRVGLTNSPQMNSTKEKGKGKNSYRPCQAHNKFGPKRVLFKKYHLPCFHRFLILVFLCFLSSRLIFPNPFHLCMRAIFASLSLEIARDDEMCL